MKKLIITTLISLFALFMQAQDSISARFNKSPLHKWYSMKGAQLIFSKGEVMNSGSYIPNILRFTCFFHIQDQYHYEFGRSFGMYTGFSIINVGFINSLGLPDGSSATLKQRSYSFGIPLGFKFGNMPHGDYLALGAEGECMFAYKQKILYNGNKTIENDNWFSTDHVNLFNPSLFAELRFHNGSYIRFKYYMLNFLQDKSYTLNIGDNQVVYTPEKSNLYYVSVGLLIKRKHKHHLTKSDV